MIQPSLEQRLRRFAPAFVLVIALLSVMSVAQNVLLDRRDRIDFNVFYDASVRLQLGQSPYPARVENLAAAYVYPEFWAAILTPLTHWPRREAGEIWYWILAGLYVFVAASAAAYGLRYSRKDTGPPQDTRPLQASMLGIFGAFGFSPVQFGWRIGQFELLVTAVLAIILLVRGRALPWVAGVCVGIAVLLKISPVLILPAVAVALGWRCLVSFGAVILVYIGAIAALGLLGREAHMFTNLLPQMQFKTGHPDHSFYRMIVVDLLGGRSVRPDGSFNGPLTYATTAVVLALYAGLCTWAWRKRAGLLACLAIGIACSHLGSSVLEPHHYTSTLLVLVPWLAGFYLREDWAPLGLLFIAWFIGYTFVPSFSVSGQPAAYALFITDAILIAVALWRPHLEKTPAEATYQA